MSLGELLKIALAGVAGGRLYPDLAPNNPTKPYLTYLHFGPINNSFAGASDFQNQRTQIDCFADTKAEAESVATQIEVAMSAQSPYSSPQMFSSMQISRSYFGVDRDVRLHRVTVEFSVWFRP